MRRFHLGKCLRPLCRSGAIFGAGLLVTVWFIVLGMVGSPRLILHIVSERIWVAPSVLFLLLATLFYAACGASVGVVLSDRRCSSALGAYRGAFFFSIGITLSYLWYALLFGARYVLPALILAVLSLVCMTVTALNFRRIMSIAANLTWLAVAIMAYFCTITIFLFFFL